MDIKRLVESANFSWLARQYLELEIMVRNNPLMGVTDEFIFNKNEVETALLDKFSARGDALLTKIENSGLEPLYLILTQINGEWQDSIETLCKGSCAEIPTTIDDLTIILKQYGVDYGDWFDYLRCIARMQPAGKSIKNIKDLPLKTFIMITHHDLSWFVLPKEGWVVHSGNPSRWEFTKDLGTHSWLNDGDVRKNI